ncbi:MAG TPA: RIP metalloprotease RseP [Longimicrobium sp.]|nr:RIP metalloprotease RseP [Longimicrobium sp.]
MLTIVSTVVVLSVLILVHELGHFLAAKAVGIQVPRFSLGFGKVLWGFRIGETEFVLSAIPLGGYVKMAGMEDDEAAEALEGPGGPAEEVDPERTFDSKSIPARVLVISAGVIMNFLFAWLIFSIVAFAYGERRITEMRVSVAGTVATPAGPALAGIREGARVTHVGGRPVSDWNTVDSVLTQASGSVELRFADAPPVKVQVPAAELERRTALAALTPWSPPVINSVVSGTPAARAGLREGDRVVQAAGAPVRSWQELVRTIQSHPGKPLPLVVQRGEQTLRVTVTPDADRVTVPPDGRSLSIGRVGAAGPRLPYLRETVGVGEAVVTGARATWATSAEIVKILRRLIVGELSPRNLGGLLSIGEASGETARLGLEVWLLFLAAFSVNLAVLNLLTIPILDGGHLMFLAFEAVRGRPLSVEARIRLSQVGLVIVVALMLWANGNDIVRIIFNR